MENNKLVLAFNYDDKIKIAEALAEAGIHRIEAGMPVVSHQDAKVVSDLAKEILDLKYSHLQDVWLMTFSVL